MKGIKIFLVLLLLAVVASAQGFEGFVKYKMEADGESTFMKYYMKDNKVRMEPEMEEMDMGGAIIFKDGKTFMVMPGQKMYMEFSNDMYNMGEGMDSESKMEDAKKPVKTGETKDILGYSTDKWVFTDDDYTTEVWAAEGLGEFVFLSTPMGQQEMPEWYEDLSSGGFFPMLVIAKTKDGKVDGRMEVVEINEESLSNDLFDIPSSYSKFSMPGGN